MILPGNLVFTNILLILGMLCWGLWANTYKLAGKWRFELYYFDFAIGAFLAALLAALTLGTFGWDGFSFLDDIRNAGKKQDLFAFLAGAVFNLGNMLLLAAISVAGMSVAFPVAAGIALITAAAWGLILQTATGSLFLWLGSAAVLIAAMLGAQAWRTHVGLLNLKRQQQPVATAKAKAPRKIASAKAVLLAAGGGLVLGSVQPLVNLARETESGLGPYSLVFLLAAGIAATTFVYNLFFMNLPVQGQPLDLSEYFRGRAKQHGLGIAGGMLWATGAVAALVAAKAEGPAHSGPVLSYAAGQAGNVIAALCGLFVWSEFTEAEGKVRPLLFFTLILFAAAWPLFPRRHCF